MKRSLALLVLVLALAGSFLWAPTRAISAAQPPPEPAGICWYNETHYEISGMAGDWRARSSDGVTRLRPVAGGTTIQLLDMQSGELLVRPVPVEGEVVLGHGWIIVNASGQDTL